MTAEPDWLTVKQVAESLQVSERTVRRLVNVHELEAVKVGSAVRISREALNAYLVTMDKLGGGT